MLKKLLAIRMKQKISIPTVNLIVPYLLFAFFVFLQIQSMIFPIVISLRNASIQPIARAQTENNEMLELFFPSHIFLNHKSDPTDSMAPISGFVTEIHLLCNIHHTGCGTMELELYFLATCAGI